MNSKEITDLDWALARVCESCPVCRHAREKQRGAAFWLVRTVERSVCPFAEPTKGSTAANHMNRYPCRSSGWIE